MILTDKEAIKALDKARIWDLDDMISDYPENERDGRSDWDMIANEAGWLLDTFRDDSHANYDALEEARQIIRETKNGKVMPVDLPSFKFRYKQYQVDDARDLINMYNRLVRFVKKLKGRGFHCPYC